MSILETFTIYDRPLDAPDAFVVRRFTIESDSPDPVPHEARVFATLEDARAAIPEGLFCIDRHDSDPLSVVETWL